MIGLLPSRHSGEKCFSYNIFWLDWSTFEWGGWEKVGLILKDIIDSTAEYWPARP